MSVVLMWGHCLRHRPYIKQHMSAGRVAHRKRLRHRPPHLTETCVRVELMVSQRRRQRANIKKTFFEKLMNIQYLNLPPYPNRWMVWLIQQGLAWRPRCVMTCCQEDEVNHDKSLTNFIFDLSVTPMTLTFSRSTNFLVNAIHSTFFYVSLQNIYHTSISLIARMSSKLGKIRTETRSSSIIFLICVISGKPDLITRPLLSYKMCSFR